MRLTKLFNKYIFDFNCLINLFLILKNNDPVKKNELIKSYKSRIVEVRKRDLTITKMTLYC